MAIDKGDRLTGKRVGQVLGLGNRRVVSEKGGIEVFRLNSQKTIKFVEPSLNWAISGECPKVPFTDRAGDIPSRLQYLG